MIFIIHSLNATGKSNVNNIWSNLLIKSKNTQPSKSINIYTNLYIVSSSVSTNYSSENSTVIVRANSSNTVPAEGVFDIL